MDTRAARELCAKRTLEEKRAPRSIAYERWASWVREFLDQRYHDRAETFTCGDDVNAIAWTSFAFLRYAFDFNVKSFESQIRKLFVR